MTADRLPECPRLVKAYLVRAVGVGAAMASFFTLRNRIRRGNLQTLEIEPPTPAQNLLICVTVWFILLAPLPWIVVPLVGWPPAIYFLWSTLKDWLMTPMAPWVAMPVLCLLGVGISLGKKHYQAVTGSTEIEVGLLACWVGLGKINEPDHVAVYAVAAGVYLIARGSENVRQGWPTIRAIVKEYRIALRYVRLSYQPKTCRQGTPCPTSRSWARSK